MSSEPIFFWKPEQEHGYLGQWWKSPFTVPTEDGGEELKYENCEHYMMHQKGVLFAPDDPVTQQILAPSGPVPGPKAIKALGRKVPNFDEEVWKKERFRIVVQGNYYKFTQNPDLKAQLLETGDRELVEASPLDRIWGVGFGAKNAPARRAKWGLNLLGKALMEVRDRIRREEEETEQDK
ncbi:hypothetical protein H109_07876 [Trichophyton interdigitale MR816]|uniref:NADAR domain-containing protein n=1 Tax=Trichophyton interdigitale (strain MR816) TaxID=1215338 RepID=A0A059IX67_TRIIM|nr:hypothetical protein H101_04358 [Trichophyton interdigitale H6]KDB20180.1 hypothetical protein H109_07876 [Trichophyton interdigitale MR816]